MRHLASENPYIIGRFETGDTVTISIYDLSDDSKVVDAASMSEVGSTGFFKYQFNPSPTSLIEYLYIMTNSDKERAGKIILGGYPDDIKDTSQSIKAKTDTINWDQVVDILKLTGYKVTKSGNIITIYENDGATVWRQYDLANGGRVQV